MGQEIKIESELLSIRVYGGIVIPMDSLANIIRALEHHRSQLSAWETKPPPDLNDFEIAASNIFKIERFLTKFDSDYFGLVLEEYSNSDDLLKKEIAGRENSEDLFKKEIVSLDDLHKKLIASRENEFEKLKSIIHEMQHEFEKLKLIIHEMQHESEKQKSIIRMFDLISIYRFYVVEKIVGGNWARFCREYNAFEDDVYDKIRSQHDFDAFLKPFDDQLGDGLTISLIMDAMEDRHKIAHSSIRSASNQRAFLEECLRIDFVDTKSKFIASKILPQLKNISLKRIAKVCEV